MLVIPKSAKTVLFITSSGGGGLLQTAIAKEQEIQARYPHVRIVKIDLLKDWIFKPIGRFFIHFWNQAQRNGDVKSQMLCVSGQFIVDFFLYPLVFFRALKTLFKEDADHIVDTQPLFTSAVIRALCLYNRKKGKKVLLEKVLVDLPTRKATHFFRSIKNLSRKRKRFFVLTTIDPLLENGESKEAFWKDTCSLSIEQINTEEAFVRSSFRSFKDKERNLEQPVWISLRYRGKKELHLLQRAWQKGNGLVKVFPKHIEVLIEPSARVGTVLLGSQPAGKATIRYVQKMIECARGEKNPVVLFVFAASSRVLEKSLLQKVSDLIALEEDFPKNLTVIPFPFQKEDVIAPLFHRSDFTCTRSGGQTAMELMSVSKGEIWIHSEAKKGKDLLSGIPGWEAASATYLQKLYGAKIITPDTFSSHVKELFLHRDLKSIA